MSLVDRIKKLCDSKNTTLVGIEREIGLGRGTIRKWDTYSPSVDKIQKVADYFSVTTDYLLGKVPFKNDQEFQYSISTAVMKYLVNHQNEIPRFFDLTSGIERLYDIKFDSELTVYAETLLNKFLKNVHLTDLELFELSNVIFKEIKWSKEFDGIVYLKNFEEDSFAIKLDINKIESINFDIDESILMKNAKSNTSSFVKYASALNNEYKHDETYHVKEEPSIYDIAAHSDGIELTEEEKQKLDEYIQFLLSRREK